MITGGSGMLASDLVRQFTNGNVYEPHPLSRAELDVTNTELVNRTLEKLKPEVLIHTAAIHVDASEEEPDLAFRVNAWASRGLAQACQRNGVTMVYISTCGLFGDAYQAYTEYDPVTLKTVYAQSKYSGENFVRDLCESHFVIRPGWLFGGSMDHPKNFVARRYEEALNNEFLPSASDKYGSPTFCSDLARGIDALLKTREYGTYHVANSGGSSRAAYVRRILECFGLPTEVKEVDSNQFPRKARVPDCEILDCLNSRLLGLSPLPPWEDAVEAYIHTIKAKACVQ